ncbi:cytochrome P450 II f2-like protein II [Elysia marginata]|uniref:Cytochrome P450 II f2-like protein II n=1 Tax=Elysia marginata TaxID=1093978 RepID=A0AAV4JU07_9GAST|nr:cytochrome P450 II f2-like protein II [Elysia marginata]
MESETSWTVNAMTSQVLTYVALFLSMVALVKYLLTSRPPANIPPFPAKPYFFLGHLPYFRNGVREKLAEWSDSSGDMFSLYLGRDLTVILNGFDIFHHAFVKHADTLSDRPASFAANLGGEEPNRGIVFASGPVWKEQRTVALHILRSFGMGKNVLASKISEEVSAYLNKLSELNAEPTEVRALTRTAVSNVICSIIVGKRFDYDDDYFVDFVKKMAELFRLSQRTSLFSLLPWLRFLPGDLFKAKERIALYRHVKDFFCRHYIEKTKREDAELNSENFISAYLQEKRRLEKQGQATTLDGI